MPFKFNPLTNRLDIVNAVTSTGDVTGPGSSTDKAIARWDGTTGKVLEDSNVIVTDLGVVQASGMTLTTPLAAVYGGSGHSSYSVGDLLYADTTTTLSSLPVGANGTVLTLSAGLPTWAAVTAGVTSVSGTLNRITSTGGSTPVIDIDAAYVGQSSITTLGTVSSGTWSATTIATTKGGTGLTSYVQGDLIYASASNVLSALSIATYAGTPLGNDGTKPVYLNPMQYLYYTDDFIGNNGNNASLLGWAPDTNGSGGTLSTGANATSGHPGVWIIGTGSSTTGSSNIRLENSSTQGMFILGGGAISIQWVCQIPTLSDGTNTFTVRIGFGSNTAADFNNGVYFQGDTNADTHWLIKTAANGSRSSTTSSNVIDTNWHRYRIDISADATLATYYVDDVSIGTQSTNIPTNSTYYISPYVQIVKSAGSTERTVNVDLFVLYQKLTNSR